MEKTYQPKPVEEKWIGIWEKNKLFTPVIDPKKKPFSIILPLPNASDPIHVGHCLFIVQDILCRYHRMKGDPTLWLPGADHAGIETQYVFEKYLAREDKSRFDFDRETLYQKIWEFVEKNREINKYQLNRLGFSLDWTRYHYSLEPQIVAKVIETFKKLHADGLIYRGERIVNYCTKCGTAFSDLEIEYIERKDPLYYIKYGPFILATTRPETKFGDTAVAFHPGDKRYEKYLGKDVEVQGVNGPFKVKVIADKEIDPKFGTGIEKVTPGHDAMDFEIGKRHDLEIKKVINPDGRLNELAGRFAGLKVKEARIAVFEAMKEMGLIDHVDENYTHRVAVCYRCGTTIEPMVIPQWFIKTKSLAKPAIEAVKKGETKIFPKKRFEKMYFQWLENIRDWNISRQIVWGPRIPAWYCLSCNPEIRLTFLDKVGKKNSGPYKELIKNYSFSEMASGLQSLFADKTVSYQLTGDSCEKCGGKNILQETDTFDTWFLSGQWPVNTLKSSQLPGLAKAEPRAGKAQSSKLDDFDYFYPTSVLDTLWDILFFWVGRMMMLGLYLTGKVPFRVVHIHSRVVDKTGQKMSKSKGNVINPIEMVEKYGADSLRMALVLGVAPASDICLSEEKIKGMRNFSNKLWNIGRFILSGLEEKSVPFYEKDMAGQTKEDGAILKKTDRLVLSVTRSLETYRFGRAAEDLYQFVWHELADKYIEAAKSRISAGDVVVLAVLRHVLLVCLALLHPFMPFVTEELWSLLPKKNSRFLAVSEWPVNSSKLKVQISKPS
ncbi:MAG: valine--tRNA ligase [bacterium]|nr:valine--tRNA ligase [bacterium]